MRQKDVFGEDMIKDIKPADIALSMVKYCESKGFGFCELDMCNVEPCMFKAVKE